MVLHELDVIGAPLDAKVVEQAQQRVTAAVGERAAALHLAQRGLRVQRGQHSVHVLLPNRAHQRGLLGQKRDTSSGGSLLPTRSVLRECMETACQALAKADGWSTANYMQ